MPPVSVRRFQAPPPFLPHHDHPLLRVMIAVVVISVIAGLIAFLVVRITSRRAPLRPVAAPATSATMQDAALAQLRMRYARGEISRTDYLQAAADLGAPVEAMSG